MNLIRLHSAFLLCGFFFFLTIGFGFAAGGFEYLPDEATLGLWHFDGDNVEDISDNSVKGDVEGKAVWYDVIIGSKNTRQFKWKGLIDEVRISAIAREADVLSPNLEAPQAVEFTELTLPLLWGSLKQ